VYSNNTAAHEIHPSPLQKALSRLEGVKETSSGYKARCPAHDDHTPSLSIAEADDGKVLLTCHAGCDTRDIVDELGLKWPDLFPDGTDASWTPWEGSEVEAYTYYNGHVEPVYQVVRFEMRDPSHPAYGEKKFLQRSYLPDHPDAGKNGCPGGYVWGRAKHDVKPLLHRLPQVLEATEEGSAIYVVEGEKDVETLERLGLTGTCSPGGAGRGDELGKTWTEAMTEVLAGANIVCLPDNDPIGHEFMDAVGSRLARAGCTVRILRLPDLPRKGDVTDWVEGCGGNPARLRELAQNCSPICPSPDSLDEMVSLCEDHGQPDFIFEHIETIARAPLSEYARVKPKLKSATGVNLNDLEAAVQEARSRLEKEERKQERSERRRALTRSDRPVIVVGDRHSREVVEEVREAVEAQNDPPRIFRRGDQPVRVGEDEDERPIISELDEAEFDDVVHESANIVDARAYRPRDLSRRHLRRVAARVRLPALRGITRIPLVRPDGSIFDTPGYDAVTGFHFRPLSELPRIPENPTAEDVENACEWLHEAWVDHPFDSEASRANTYALALTPIVRPMLDRGNAPFAIVDATRPGSGKTMLAETAGTAGTGQIPAVMGAPSGDDEWRKQITAQLRRGERFVIVDDVTGTINNPSIRRAISAPVWSDRILGASDQLRLRSEATWCATGNNLRPQGDMVRRCYLIRLDTEMVRPYKRTDFKHEQPAWTRKHRGELAAALLTLVRAWVVAGQPAPDAPVMGGFTRWVHVVGGVLQNAGIDGFLDNLDELEDTAFSEDDQWARLLAAIYEWARDCDATRRPRFTAGDLAESVESNYSGDPMGRDPVVMRIVEDLPDRLVTKLRRREPIAHSLGKALHFRMDRKYPGGWYLRRRGKGRNGVIWEVHRDDVTIDRDATRPGDPHPPSEPNGVGGAPTGEGPNPSSHRHSCADEAPF
jgi:hypothetical protein